MTYVKSRLWEAAWRRNIRLEFKLTSKFNLVVSKEGVDKIYYDGQQAVLPDCGK